jgi:hypothetical protein
MNKDKLKLIIRNLELLIDSLKAEVFSDTQSCFDYDEVKNGLHHDYDEIFDDNDE